MTVLRSVGSVVAIVLGVLGYSSAASADVILEPPETCPIGSFPNECHGPDLCELRDCQSDADCSNGRTCMELQLCTSPINCGGGTQDIPKTTVHGVCNPAGECGSGQCSTLNACVQAEGGSTATTGGTTGGTGGGTDGVASSEGGSDKGGCGCHAPASPGALGLLPLVMLGWSRIRSRSPR